MQIGSSPGAPALVQPRGRLGSDTPAWPEGLIELAIIPAASSSSAAAISRPWPPLFWQKTAAKSAKAERLPSTLLTHHSASVREQLQPASAPLRSASRVRHNLRPHHRSLAPAAAPHSAPVLSSLPATDTCLPSCLAPLCRRPLVPVLCASGAPSGASRFHAVPRPLLAAAL